MNILYCLTLLAPVFALADDSAADRMTPPPPPQAADVRSFSEKDMLDLADRMAKDLRGCKQLKKGAQLESSFQNATSEYIDKDAFTKAIVAQLPPSAGGPGKKYDLSLKLSSTAQQKGQDYEGSYTLAADLKQAEEVLCRKTEKLVKKGKIAPPAR